MPRARTPTNVLKLRGVDKVHPERMRERENEPEAAGDVGDPPEWLTEIERGCWIELVALSHEGVLCTADRAFIEYGARVWAQLRSEKTIDPKLAIRFENVLARLGMTPADRSRVSAVKKNGEADPYDEFAAA